MSHSPPPPPPVTPAPRCIDTIIGSPVHTSAADVLPPPSSSPSRLPAPIVSQSVVCSPRVSNVYLVHVIFGRKRSTVAAHSILLHFRRRYPKGRASSASLVCLRYCRHFVTQLSHACRLSRPETVPCDRHSALEVIRDDTIQMS